VTIGMALLRRGFSPARDLMFGLGAGLLAFGFLRHPPAWELLAPRLADALVAALGAGLVAGLLSWRFRTSPAALLLAALVPALGILLSGLTGAVATALLLAGAAALATLLPATTGVTVVVRWLAGLMLLAGIGGWWLPFPVHHVGTWGPALALLVAWRREAIARDARSLAGEFRDACRAAPRTAFVASLLVTVSTLPAWLPVWMADDVSYHLMLPWELMRFGHARFDIGTQVWALAPWSTDVLHAVTSVLAGHETTGFLNAAWLLAAAWLVQCLGRALGLPAGLAWLAVAAYATLPMTFMLAGSLQVESATPALFAALALVLLQRLPASPGPMMLVAVLAGGLLGSKTSNGLLLLPFLAWWLWQWRTGVLRPALLPALVLGLLAAGSSYAYAWALSGNPVLPLFNGLFQSPWFPPEDFLDTRWTQGLGWDLPWRWVVEPDRFHEGIRGAAGIVPWVMLGALPFAVAAARSRALALAAMAAAALLLSQIQYLRYLHPLMPLFCVLMVAGAAGHAALARQRLLTVAASLLVAVQFVLLPTASWGLVGDSLRRLAQDGPDAALLNLAPERLLARHFRTTAAPDDLLLFTQSGATAIAELPRQSMAMNWHSETLWKLWRIEADWPAVFTASGATHLVTRDPASLPGLPEAMAGRGARAIAHAGLATLYRLDAAPLALEAVAGGEPGTVQRALPLDPAHASTGHVTAILACDTPGRSLELMWQLDRGERTPLQRWDLALCDPQGRAEARMSYASLAQPGRLQLVVMPGDVGAAPSLLSAQASRRQDPSAESERFHVVWDALCRRPGCGRDRYWLRKDGWESVRD